MLMRNTLIFLALAGVPSAAFAAGDMLQPNEIQTTGIEANPANDSGVFLGAGLSFGQARTTEEGASPGTAYFLHLEPGYQVRRGSFGRLEFSGDLLFGQGSFRQGNGGGTASMNVGFGLLLKAGFGYSLGDKAYGLVKIGAGPAIGKVTAHPDGAGKVESDTISGLAAYLGWTMVMPLSEALDATGGISWTHFQMPVDKLKGSGGAEYAFDQTVIVNVPALELGLRLRI